MKRFTTIVGMGFMMRDEPVGGINNQSVHMSMVSIRNSSLIELP